MRHPDTITNDCVWAMSYCHAGTLKTPLVVAAEKGHAEIAALLLLFGADVHAATSRNKTAAYCACEHDHAPTLRVLLRYGAGDDLDAETNYGTTPLYIAFRNRCKRVQALLGDKFQRKKGGGRRGGGSGGRHGPRAVAGGEFGHALQRPSGGGGEATESFFQEWRVRKHHAKQLPHSCVAAPGWGMTR